MALRLTSRGRARGATARGTGALLAVAVTAGLTTQISPAMAEEKSDAGAESYLADLVGQVSSTEEEVGNLESELGGLRESVNKSRVDFERTTREAQEAQNQVTDARSRLGGSQDDLDSAQADLNEIARSAYTQGGDASPVPLAAGSSADDTIDRATYIRMAAERQQAEVDRLDLARTQAANEEARLRDSRNNANALVEAAQQAQADAQAQFERVQQDLSTRAQEHSDLLARANSAREQLAAARAAVDRVGKDEDATSFDKRRAAEAAVEKVDTTPASLPATQETPEVQSDGLTAAPGSGAKIEGLDDDTTTDGTDVPVSPAEDQMTAQSDDSAAVQGDTSTEGSVEGSFTPDAAGDDRRQAAIDGLLGAAGAAVVAGAGAAANGGDPLSAAADAARSSAAQSYGNLPAAASGVGEDTGTVPDATLPGTTPDSTGNTGDTSEPDTSGTAAEQIERVIDRGMSQLGVTYAWGGGDWNGPTLGIRDGGVADSYGDYAKVGFDCSGLMMYAFYAVGIQLEHYSGYQYTAGPQVPVSEAKRGDMLFWGVGGSSHVALYLGDGKMLEAPQSGDVVKVSDVRWNGIMPMATRMIQ